MALAHVTLIGWSPLRVAWFNRIKVVFAALYRAHWILDCDSLGRLGKTILPRMLVRQAYCEKLLNWFEVRRGCWACLRWESWPERLAFNTWLYCRWLFVCIIWHKSAIAASACARPICRVKLAKNAIILYVNYHVAELFAWHDLSFELAPSAFCGARWSNTPHHGHWLRLNCCSRLVHWLRSLGGHLHYGHFKVLCERTRFIACWLLRTWDSTALFFANFKLVFAALMRFSNYLGIWVDPETFVFVKLAR